jgi:hypothetical protein
MADVKKLLAAGAMLSSLAGCYYGPPPVSYYTAPCPPAGAAAPPSAPNAPPPANAAPPAEAVPPAEGQALCTYGAQNYAYAAPGYGYGPYAYPYPYYGPAFFGPSFGFFSVGGGRGFHGGFHGGGHFR